MKKNKKFWSKLKGWQLGMVLGLIIGLIFAILSIIKRIVSNKPLNLFYVTFIFVMAISLGIIFSLLGFFISEITNWKKTGYWRRGAMIGIAVNFVLYVLTMILSSVYIEIKGLFMYIEILIHYLPLHIAANLLHVCGGEDCIPYILLSFVWVPIFGFLTGALIGLIISKIKKHRC